jgi:PiT family inorganic phosphate transporter
MSTGLVAFGIIALLPVELILQVGSANGFAMIFAFLCLKKCLKCLKVFFFKCTKISSKSQVVFNDFYSFNFC